MLGSAGGRASAPCRCLRAGSTVPDRQRRHADRHRSRAVVADHQRSGALVTMAVVPQHRAGQVRRRRRRRRMASSPASSGADRTSRRITSSACRWPRPRRSPRCPADVPYEIGRRALPGADRRSDRVRCARYRATGEFIDIGTPADYLDTSLPLAARERRRHGGTRRDSPDRARRATRSCGTMWSWRMVRCCASASSPTACAYRRTRRGTASRSASRRASWRRRTRIDGPGDRLALKSEARRCRSRLRHTEAPRHSRACVVIVDDRRRQPDRRRTRTRIDQFLAETGLAARGAKVVPLTGDASDRRYFRVLLRDEPSQVLAVHPRPIDVRAAAVRQRRAAAQRDAGAGAARSSGTRTSSASWRCRISATSRCRRISAPPRRPSTPRSTAQAVIAHRDAAAARPRAGVRPATCPTASRSTSRS